MQGIGGPQPLRSNYGAEVRTVRYTTPREDLKRQLRQARPKVARKAAKAGAKREARAERTRSVAARIDHAAEERKTAGIIRMAEM